ncbi:glycosyltransferase family 29 protein [Bartonella apis]|uniref:Glycosyltransferase family 29 (Sialyltransferase) n=1 Tax=Bartonella apis TaxID=1686310 RepID=A0A1R0FAV3_9HYPH|nr:glycosyltransferase family 29 protein [Bartonella apis]OLY44048.1 Glycosyltransferase family 29 (sialyltransferase) [Bartonella apis]OLY44855.1 Glycosyltransferase family 29 (sialyltransferase) [Bartonella apis]
MKTQKRRFIVVGNADLPRDLSREIDSADYVLRFNQPRLLDGWSGSKTSCLMMCNSGKPMQEKLEDPTFLECKFFKQAELITFVYHPYIMKTYFARPRLLSQLFKHRRVDWTKQAIKVLGEAGKDILIKSAQFYLDACAEIGIKDEKLKEWFPSTGYLGIWDFLHHYDLTEWEIYICGFTWKGWKHHAWSTEERWVRERVNEGTCHFLE